MRINKFFGKKKPAQAMVEFAIALPVLLLLLYGILEAGRYLFLYSTVVSASRQAVRYGTATGDGGGATPVYGTSRAVVPRFRDCAGIRGAGNAVAYITRGGFTYGIKWDKGPNDASPTPMCPSGTTNEISSTPSDDELRNLNNTARLVVTASTEFVPLVKLVPFAPRTVSATSARTILYSVSIQVDQEFAPVPQSTVDLKITVSPEPSLIGQPTTITVVATDPDDATNIPKGDVIVFGGFDGGSCTIHLTGGTGTCPATFSYDPTVTYPNTYTLTGLYTPGDGDVDHGPSDPNNLPHGDHVVTKIATKTTITQVSPLSAVPNQKVTFFVTVTNATMWSAPVPTGTVTITAQDGGTCQAPLDGGGTGNCSVIFTNSNPNTKTITATYPGDNTHQGSTDTKGYDVLDVTPTPKATATATAKPTATATPTTAPSPTPMPTPVASCSSLKWNPGPITYSGNTMSMSVTNPYSFSLTMSNTTVTWNDDKGHVSGTDKTLVLLSASVNGTTFWTGTSNLRESTKTLPGPATFQPGPNTITFTFDKSYENPEPTDQIVINWLTPGCETNPVDSKH